jgi:lipocalin
MKVLCLLPLPTGLPELTRAFRNYFANIGQAYYFYQTSPVVKEPFYEIKNDVITTTLPILIACQQAGLLKDVDYTLEIPSGTCLNLVVFYDRFSKLKNVDPAEGLIGPCTLTPVGKAVVVFTKIDLTVTGRQTEPGKPKPKPIVFSGLTPTEQIATLRTFNLEYRAKVINYYKRFVGTAATQRLVAGFKIDNFVGTWYQVATSTSTEIYGTGLTKKDVKAVYTFDPKFPDYVSLVNSAINEEGKTVEIKGRSFPRNPALPVCRTVQFEGLKPVGDYWIIYLSANVLVVAAPLIINGMLKDPRFGIYVLARNRAAFEQNLDEQKLLADLYKKYGYTKPANTPMPTA